MIMVLGIMSVAITAHAQSEGAGRALEGVGGSGGYAGFVSFGQGAYSWTDKVYITVVAPDYNFDSRAVDSIGDTEHDSIKISTREGVLREYRLVETGPDTGIFTGEVTLIGFDYDADGNSRTGDRAGYDNPQRATGGSGPTGGYIKAGGDDAITVSFEYTEGHTVVSTAIIRWSVGQVQWLESFYPESGAGTVRVIDPDMNWNPEAANSFEIVVWSDSDPGGVTLAVTEREGAPGVFEGTVSFTSTAESSGHRLRVAEGDAVTARYEDNTLPAPYSSGDELSITAHTQISLQTAPLERVRVSDLRITDGFGASVVDGAISEGQQVQVTSSLTNKQTKEQPFTYIVMIRDEDGGIVLSLSWIMGHLHPKQTLSASTSWMPKAPGTYDITVFVWESMVKPAALAPVSHISATVN